jgi:hypothetical protein
MQMNFFLLVCFVNRVQKCGRVPPRFGDRYQSAVEVSGLCGVDFIGQECRAYGARSHTRIHTPALTDWAHV